MYSSAAECHVWQGVRLTFLVVVRQVSLHNRHQGEQMVTQRKVVPVYHYSSVVPSFKTFFVSKEDDRLRLITLLDSLLLCR